MSDLKSSRILIVSTSQPGANPRMKKEADALSAAGYDVHVLYAFRTAWASEADRLIFEACNWTHELIGGDPKQHPWAYHFSRTLRKWDQWLGNQERAACRGFRSFQSAIQRHAPDFLIGHNPGALPLLRWAKVTLGVPVLFDAEDYHSGEFEEGSLEHRQTQFLEDQNLPVIGAISAASPLIAEAYRKRFPSLQVDTVNNAFPTSLQPNFEEDLAPPLKLVWFSQVIGLDRGLQEFFHLLEPLQEIHIDITLIGRSNPKTIEELEGCLLHPEHQLKVLPPMPETDLARVLAQHHIGLALETTETLNHQLCRANKLFMYPLTGCLMLVSSTPGQNDFLSEHPETGISLTRWGEIEGLIRLWSEDATRLNEMRKKAWVRAKDQLNWERESHAHVERIASMVNR